MKTNAIETARKIIVGHLNRAGGVNEEYEFYANTKLGDIAMDSLELFEMIAEIENALKIAIDDSVIDGDATIEGVLAIIIRHS